MIRICTSEQTWHISKSCTPVVIARPAHFQNDPQPHSMMSSCNRRAHSFVQLAADAATGQRVAIKFLQRDSLDAAATLREVQHQRACAGHPHIVQLLVRCDVSDTFHLLPDGGSCGEHWHAASPRICAILITSVHTSRTRVSPRLQDVFVTPRHLAIVMEHCNGGDLASLISKRLRHGVGKTFYLAPPQSRSSISTLAQTHCVIVLPAIGGVEIG